MLGVGEGRVVVCWTPEALVAHPTLPKLKTSTDLCPVDLGDVFSSRAEFLGLGMGECKVTRKRPREKSDFKE